MTFHVFLCVTLTFRDSLFSLSIFRTVSFKQPYLPKPLKHPSLSLLAPTAGCWQVAMLLVMFLFDMLLDPNSWHPGKDTAPTSGPLRGVRMAVPWQLAAMMAQFTSGIRSQESACRPFKRTVLFGGWSGVQMAGDWRVQAPGSRFRCGMQSQGAV